MANHFATIEHLSIDNNITESRMFNLYQSCATSDKGFDGYSHKNSSLLATKKTYISG